ncbi:hypothetical protein PsorP6_002045 [Peronosclerospora sorghi]|uniref:Uncharacterized protein n=1 Tax=Peronosclerospora sorghi TaxID=230839 RepID=A0ACC0WSE7_9STRA|nr:hypothetical protein PsorP6_002045 [Peronosclerospora sorghi]
MRMGGQKERDSTGYAHRCPRKNCLKVVQCTDFMSRGELINEKLNMYFIDRGSLSQELWI